MALVHIVGSIVTVIVFGVFTLWVASWEIEHNQKREREELAIRLGVAVADLDEQDMVPRIIQLSSERFSSDLLRNRISDLAGIVRAGWGWFGSAIQLIVLGVVIWQSFSDDPGNAIYAWSIVATAIFFWVVSVGFSLLCRLLTGRYPGQAKLARKSMAEFLSASRGNLSA